MFKGIFAVKRVFNETSEGKILEKAGTAKTSSKVKPSLNAEFPESIKEKEEYSF
jgi:hypothetical protein